MGVFFKVKDYEKIQHYGAKRTPPWIKLYAYHLDDYEFGKVPDAIKGQVFMLKLLASRHENLMPWDKKWVSSKIQSTAMLDLSELERLGFIEKVTIEGHQNASKDASNSDSTIRRDKIRIDKTPLPPKGELVSFEGFWKAYPKKLSKGQARKAWLKLNPNEQLIAQIFQAIERAKTSESWRKDNGQFIPYPATWLNAERWLDEHGKPVLAVQKQGCLHDWEEKSNQFGKVWSECSKCLKIGEVK